MKNKGFSLIEFLITLATLSVGAYKGLEFLENQRSEILLVHQEIEMQAINQDIRKLLMNTQNCTASLLGHSLNTPEGQITHLTNISTIDDKQYSSRAYPTSEDPNQSYGPSRLRIQSYKLVKHETQSLSSQFIVSFDQSYARGKRHQALKQQTHIIFLELDENEKITKCSMKPLHNEQRFWRNKANSLAYSEGFVGVLNPSPQLNLDIIGRIQFQPSSGIKECDQARKGMLNVLSEDNRLQLCDGSSWVKF